MGPNKVKYPMHDELGFLESKYKLIMSSVFKVLKEMAEIQVRKLTDCFELHEYTSKMANLQKESGFKKHVVTLQARNTCAAVLTNIQYHTP